MNSAPATTPAPRVLTISTYARQLHNAHLEAAKWRDRTRAMTAAIDLAVERRDWTVLETVNDIAKAFLR